ncbi:MAG: Rrf2 family transcriptional regulator [Candidatus Levybacteria bacterium]|nr:Rrf2 family transcriptional regulator [Candidatus Levybacteria bacterium]
MIHFSKQEDYAVVLLTKLAQNYNKRLIPLSEIANEYKISPLFLRNLAFELRKNGIIGAKEGKSGGYFLGKDPKDLKVGEVLSIFEKRPMLDCCSFSNSKKKSKCEKEKICNVSMIWKRMNKEFLDKVSSLTFHDFIKNNIK